jgi:succinyl-diaminopimelate desuccinylase
MVQTLIDLCKIPAISPKTNGDGETKKASWLAAHLKKLGFANIEWYNSPDKTVSSGERPNIVVRVPGKDRSRTVWVVTHTDVVPEGDLKKWSCDPFKPILKNGKIIGRGVADNGQELVSSLFALKAIVDLEITPQYNVALAFVADEEVGSLHGIQYLIEKKLFSKNDLLVVPDAATSKGDMIEIAEKTGLWLKITTIGKQTHGSTPSKGRNAHKAAASLICAIDPVIYKKFGKKDNLFSPNYSTFEPTKKDSNVPNINTIPGEDVYYMDCRVLPIYSTENVIKTIRQEADKIEKRFDVKIKIEKVSSGKGSPMTRVDSEIFIKLSNAIEEIRGFRPEPIGIGGGTCAALFRNAGYPAVVWMTGDEVAHAADEFVCVKNLVNDAKVYAALYL